MDFRKLAALNDHLFDFGRDHFGGDVTVNDLANLENTRSVIGTLFRDQRRVGGDPINDAVGGSLGDLLDVGGIQKELHS